MTLTRAQHLEASVARMASVYKDKPVLRAFLSAVARQAADLDTVLANLYTDRGLETADGAQLDQLGRVLDEARGALEDTAYRAKLQLKIIRIYSEGTAATLLQIFQLLTNAAEIEFTEVFPASISLVAVEPDGLLSDTTIRQAMDSARAAGVSSAYISKTNGLPAFAFAGDMDANKAGFGTTADPDVGGRFASIIR